MLQTVTSAPSLLERRRMPTALVNPEDCVREFGRLGRGGKLGRGAKLGRGGPDLLGIYGSDLLLWSRSDIVTLSGSSVTAWPDISGNAHHHTVSDAPQYTATDSTLGNLPSILLDGSNDAFHASLTLGTPATTPVYIYLIIKQLTWVANRSLLSDTASRFALVMSTSSPGLALANPTVVDLNNSLPTLTWGCVTLEFTGSGNDALKCIGNRVSSGSNAGNNAGGGTRHIGCNNAVSVFTNISIAEIAYVRAIPTTIQKSQEIAYVNNRYPTGLAA